MKLKKRKQILDKKFFSNSVSLNIFDHIRNNDIKSIKRLIEAGDSGAVLDIKNSKGYTALAWAAAFNKTEIVKLLIDDGANINIKNNFGSTALIHASFNDNIEMVELLIASGANINIKNNQGKIAIDYWRGDKRIFDLKNKKLKKREENLNKILKLI